MDALQSRCNTSDIVASFEEIVCALPQSHINLLEGLCHVLISDIGMVRGEAPMPLVILDPLM
jgi:hypothetical protein